MVNRDLVAAKLSELSDRLRRVRAHRPAGPEDLRADRDALDIVAFNLMLAVQTCADITSHIIADQGWPAARTLAEGFTRLAERGVLESATAQRLGRAVGLRNVVAHGYAGINVNTVYEAATDGLGDLEAFAEQVSVWTERQARP